MKTFLLALALAVTAVAEVRTVTAYCACAKCCGAWASKKPQTASGTTPKQGRTVAAPRSVAFGSKVTIAGLGTFVAEDRLAKKFDGRYDVFFADHEAAKRFGIRRLNVTVKPKEKGNR